MTRRIRLPLDKDTARTLVCGDSVLLSGTLYTARDAAHKRLTETLKKGERLPVSIEGEVLYYVGPTPPKPGQVVGSAGPTTSARMDRYTPLLLDNGLAGMIGKGDRAEEVVAAIQRNESVYFAAVGGAGALLAQHILSAEVVAYEDLGTEAVYRFQVEDFPVTVAIDALGNNLYERGVADYLNSVTQK